LLTAWLEFHRATLLSKCAGLTAEQLAARSPAPSGLSLLGLVRHMTELERLWFRQLLGGEELSGIYFTSDNPDGDFNDGTPASAAADLEVYLREVELARAATAGHKPDETILVRDSDVSVRWIYLHMIGEYARHNGHADQVREHADGAMGL